jgi:hypothetical protein
MDDPLQQRICLARAELALSEAEARRAADMAAHSGQQADVDRALLAHERLARLRIALRAGEETLARRRSIEEIDARRYTI